MGGGESRRGRELGGGGGGGQWTEDWKCRSMVRLPASSELYGVPGGTAHRPGKCLCALRPHAPLPPIPGPTLGNTEQANRLHCTC